MITYRHSFFTNRTLSVEIYNDGQIAAVVNDRKELLECLEIEQSAFGPIISVFNG